MPSLILIVFLLNVLMHIINTVGASAIDELAYTLYANLLLPFLSTSSPSSQKTNQLKKELLALKKELAGVSAQDDFAKWARLRRKHDKFDAEYTTLSQSSTSTRTSALRLISFARTAATTGLRLLLQFYHSKTPMFWIPAGWLPWYAEWILSFPRAPRGSVSIQVWGVACGSCVRLVGEAVVGGWGLYRGGKEGARVNIKMEGEKRREGERMGVGVGAGGEKKEL